jgi:hypothetical protein
MVLGRTSLRRRRLSKRTREKNLQRGKPAPVQGTSAWGRFATIMTPHQLKERAMATELHRGPCNKGIIVGQKAPLKLKEVWAIRMRLQLAHRSRELALFNLGVDSKLRACDLVQLRVGDICHGDRVANRAIVTTSGRGTRAAPVARGSSLSRSRTDTQSATRNEVKRTIAGA